MDPHYSLLVRETHEADASSCAVASFTIRSISALHLRAARLSLSLLSVSTRLHGPERQGKDAKAAAGGSERETTARAGGVASRRGTGYVGMSLIKPTDC